MSLLSLRPTAKRRVKPGGKQGGGELPMWRSPLHDDALYNIRARGGPFVREGYAQRTGSNAMIQIALFIPQMVVMAQIFVDVDFPPISGNFHCGF